MYFSNGSEGDCKVKKGEMILNLNICECWACDCDKYEQVSNCCIQEEEKQEEYKQYLKRIKPKIIYLKQRAKQNKEISIENIEKNIFEIEQYFQNKKENHV